MTTNAQITLYHHDEDSGVYTVYHHPASLHKAVKSTPDDNGFRYDDVYKIRVPTTAKIQVRTGDYIRFGTYYDTRPDKAACAKIQGFSDDRRGVNPHWRIEAV